MAESLRYDVVVIGGGISGLCAAVACARQSVKTLLVHNRPVLGGNASSEIRMHICGASTGGRENGRETGIVEEILLENKRVNPQHSFSVFDTILWEKAKFQENLDLMLNTHISRVSVDKGRINGIYGISLTTEKEYSIGADIFVDGTGDGTIAYLGGASFMYGREGKDEYNEELAPLKKDSFTMGNTLMFKACDMGKPVEFVKPFWANTYTEEDLKDRNHDEISTGYWWIELGGIEDNVISQGEEIRDELLKAVYGIWDHIKNSGHHNARNMALEWVGFLPGKRESRRIKGDYVLTEGDLMESREFPDAIAYGGWPLDDHVFGDLSRTQSKPNRFCFLKDLYNIPYRCIYSKDLENLFVAGRAISVTHIAFSSTRVMGTCAVVGQAVGIASAFCIKRGLNPRDMLPHVEDIRRQLHINDCYIHRYRYEDPGNLAFNASVSCSSFHGDGFCTNVINGYTRPVGDASNMWVSGKIKENPQWISLKLNKPEHIVKTNIIFDSNLTRQIMLSLSPEVLSRQHDGVSPELVKDFDLYYLHGGQVVKKLEFKDNYQRFISVEGEITADEVKVVVLDTNGDERAKIIEIMIF